MLSSAKTIAYTFLNIRGYENPGIVSTRDDIRTTLSMVKDLKNISHTFGKVKTKIQRRTSRKRAKAVKRVKNIERQKKKSRKRRR